MSRKNHRRINGQLIQIDKTFDHLKGSQVELINEWLYLAYSEHYWECGKPPGNTSDDAILDAVYAKIETNGIWIPLAEVQKYYHSKKQRFGKRYKRENC